MFEFNLDFAGLTRVFETINQQREEIAVPQGDLGKSFSYSKSRMSDPSVSIDEVNVPEVSNQKAEFNYNYYTKDERIKSFKDAEKHSVSKVPRYVKLSWTSPAISQLETKKIDIARNSPSNNDLSIKANADKVMSEDNFFNPGYINHTFSSVDAITQGASDLENYSIMSQHNAESLFKMSKIQIRDIADAKDNDDTSYKSLLSELTDSYTKLADFPKNSLGLRIYDESNKLVNNDDVLRSITDAVNLNVKINNAIVPDIFVDSKEKNSNNYKALTFAYSESQNGYKKREALNVLPVQNDVTSTSYLTQPIKFLGYIIERYAVTKEGFKKENTFYIEDIQQTTFEDKTVLYGVTYLYTIKVVVSVKMLTYDSDGVTVKSSTLYVSSKSVSIPVECYEFVPPPEPNDIKFTFDYDKRNLIVIWDSPVNPQKDIKQFQVFRRKNIKEPFELIAQYGFDMSETGLGVDGKYKTGERIDANNYYNMSPDDRQLVFISDKPVYMHVDEDFNVDPEFFISSEYIYAIAAVDAHGMISNYSSQHHVVFDPYKNRLITKVICDAGSPRQYPNMKLRSDAFKDVINIEGLGARKLNVYFTPEYLKVRDDRNFTYNIVEAQTLGSNSHYLLQLINLDNQKMQLLKINIKDPQNLTT